MWRVALKAQLWTWNVYFMWVLWQSYVLTFRLLLLILSCSVQQANKTYCYYFSSKLILKCLFPFSFFFFFFSCPRWTFHEEHCSGAQCISVCCAAIQHKPKHHRKALPFELSRRSLGLFQQFFSDKCL